MKLLHCILFIVFTKHGSDSFTVTPYRIGTRVFCNTFFTTSPEIRKIIKEDERVVLCMSSSRSPRRSKKSKSRSNSRSNYKSNSRSNSKSSVSPNSETKSTESNDSQFEPGSDEIIDKSLSRMEQGLQDHLDLVSKKNTIDDVGETEPMQQTLSGGPALIFAMARRMLVWEDESYEGDPNTRNSGPYKSIGSSESKSQTSITASSSKTRTVLPRWHPHDGIADNNPYFRSEQPLMNNRGYAGVIRRNSRKRGKISLWRHAIRVYDKMRTLEEEGGGELRIRRGTEHHEAALVAYAKLGLWRDSLRIYTELANLDVDNTNSISYVAPDDSSDSRSKYFNRPEIISEDGSKEKVTDNMILSIISACVRGSKSKKYDSPKERRAPLDAAKDIVFAMEKRHDIVLASRHVNSLAAAYQKRGLSIESSNLLQRTLAQRTKPTLKNDDTQGYSSAGAINEVSAKDGASYNILIQGAVSEGDWSSAIDSLRSMTETGHYPSNGNLNSWTEIANKRERRGSGRKMKKTRERISNQ